MLHFHTFVSREALLKSYKKGFKNYLQGDWQKSKEYFEKCLMMNPSDGPSKTLLSYIESNDFESKNVNWKGYRVLTDK